MQRRMAAGADTVLKNPRGPGVDPLHVCLQNIHTPTRAHTEAL